MPKDLETKKEEHLTFYQERVKEMTTEERIAFLEHEKEFWMQVQKKDTLSKEEHEEGYQKNN